MANRRIQKKRSRALEALLIESVREGLAIDRGERDSGRVTIAERLPDNSVVLRCMTAAEWRALEREPVSGGAPTPATVGSVAPAT